MTRDELEAELYKVRAALHRIAAASPSLTTAETLISAAKQALAPRKPKQPEKENPEPVAAPVKEWTPEPTAPEQEQLAITT